MRARIAEPSEIVIWAASGLLAIVLGIGGAFFLWAGFRGEEHWDVVAFFVAGLGAGVLLLGLAARQYLIRAVLVLFAVTLVLSFIAGSPSFARLV
jgi:hypothetical protein